MGLGEIYNDFMINQCHPLSYEWPLVCSPNVIFIILGYLYFVLWAGPRYMKNRPPYRLKKIIFIYNLFQILINAWFVKEHISYGWLSEFYLPQTACPFPISPKGLRILNVLWCLYLLKLFDFFETCIFVLRKKQEQVSFLHVFHHVSIVIHSWHYLRIAMDERATFTTLANCTVHVIMYMYYFASSWSPELQKMISPLKPFVTKLQMVQFVLLLAGTVYCALTLECPPPMSTTIFFITIMSIYLFLFYKFYVNIYAKKLKQKNK